MGGKSQGKGIHATGEPKEDSMGNKELAATEDRRGGSGAWRKESIMYKVIFFLKCHNKVMIFVC